jgi:hypothetical protein
VDGRSVAWLSYLPVPGLALVAAFAAREDRLARFHAWQGGLLVASLYHDTALLGFVGRLLEATWWRTLWGLLAGFLLLAGLVGIGVGIAGSLRGRHDRVRPVWDLLRPKAK